jgi:predicted amidohydrolase
LVSSGNWFGLEYGQRTQRLTRAIENHLYVAYSMRTGANDNRTFHGDSAIVDPFGHALAVVVREEALLLATIEPRVIDESKVEFNYFSDRRPELYGLLLDTPAPKSGALSDKELDVHH